MEKNNSDTTNSWFQNQVKVAECDSQSWPAHIKSSMANIMKFGTESSSQSCSGSTSHQGFHESKSSKVCG